MEELLKETSLLTKLCEEGVFNTPTSSKCDVHTPGLQAVMSFVEHAVAVFSQKRYMLSDIMLQLQDENSQTSEHHSISMKHDLSFRREALSQIIYDENNWSDMEELKKKIHQYLEESRKSRIKYVAHLKIALEKNLPSTRDSFSYHYEESEKASTESIERNQQKSQEGMLLTQSVGVQTEDDIYSNIVIKQETNATVLDPLPEHLVDICSQKEEDHSDVEEKIPRKKRKISVKVKKTSKRKITKPRKCKKRQKKIKLIDIQNEETEKEEEEPSPNKETDFVKYEKKKKQRKKFHDPLMVPSTSCTDIEKQVREVIDVKTSRSIPSIHRKKDLLMAYMQLKCCICNNDETFLQVSALTRHQFDQHAVPNLPDIKDTSQESTHIGRIDCKNCSVKFELSKSSYSYDQAMLRVATQYVNHVTSKHGDPMPYWIRQRVCPEKGCKFIGITAKSNYQHVKGHEKGSMTCEYCGRFLKKMCMKKHYTTCKTLVSKNTRKTHPCTECGKKFMSEIGYQRHMLNIHQQERNHLCFICSEMFFAKTTLYQHVFKAHNINISGKDLKKCRHCDFTALPTMIAMHIHNAHPSKGLYTCEKCGKLFDQENYLRIHQRIHLTEKKYKCEYCSYAASRPDYLRAHVSSQHINPEKFKCPWCEYTCGHRGNMAKHRKICRLRPPGVSPYLSGSKPAYIRPPNEHTLIRLPESDKIDTPEQNIDHSDGSKNIMTASMNLSTTENVMPIHEFQQENRNSLLTPADMMPENGVS